MDPQAVRKRAQAHCDALIDGDIERAAEASHVAEPVAQEASSGAGSEA